MRLWHVTERELAPGDRIQPGRWGRKVLAAGISHPLYFKEHLVEHVRATEFPHHVSRWSCAYAFETRTDTRVMRHDRSHLYRVEPATATSARTRCAMAWMTPLNEGVTDPTVTIEMIRSYWSGTGIHGDHPDQIWEWMIDDALVVVERVAW